MPDQMKIAAKIAQEVAGENCSCLKPFNSCRCDTVEILVEEGIRRWIEQACFFIGEETVEAKNLRLLVYTEGHPMPTDSDIRMFITEIRKLFEIIDAIGELPCPTK